MADIQKIKEDSNILDVIGRHVQLKKKGSEYVGLCPFHADNSASLMVNERKQKFGCFACDTSGDSIDFLTELGMDFNDAIKEITGGDVNSELNTKLKPTNKREKKPTWKYSENQPQETPEFNHPFHGKPSTIWSYKDQNSKIVCYVCRFDLKDGTKQVLPFSFATNGNSSKWVWMGIPENRPIYNLHLVKKYPKANIIVVEGEKTADAGQKEFDPTERIFITWIGGANGLVKTDFSTLHGRKIVLFPDNDKCQKFGKSHKNANQVKPWNLQPGNAAMLKIYDLIKNKSTVNGIIKNPDDLADKWDCADKTWKKKELFNFLVKNLIPVPTKFEAVVPKQTNKIPPKNPALPPVKSSDSYIENEHYRFLGYIKDDKQSINYYFYSYAAKSVVRFAPGSMTSSNLLTIAPINYWESHFPGKSKMDTGAAQQYLISNSHKLGIFKEKNIRGRGAWVDDGNIILHTGANIISEGESMPLMEFKSNYVYEIGENLGITNGKPLLNKDSKKILEKMKFLQWERGANAYLLAGWCVLAPFCGVLNWRPHIYLTGPSGAGKSWIMEVIIKSLMGDTAIAVQSKTTEPGVRGLLQSDARPLLFDEADIDNVSDIDRIQNIIALARASSHSDGGGIVKGTQSGSSRTYIIRSMFAFSSIGIQITKQSDKSRFTILGLKRFEEKQTDDDWMKFENDWMNLVDDDFVQSLQSRTLNLFPVILENSKIFSKAVTSVINSRRIGDQIGIMLSASWSLISSKLVTYNQAVKWVKKMDWSDEQSLEVSNDENELFSLIMSKEVRVESVIGGYLDRSVGELILICNGNKIDVNVNSNISGDRLRRAGIIIENDKIIIANTSNFIRSIVEKTSWSRNHGKTLQRLKDAESLKNPITFGPGLNSRAISIPISMISKGYEKETVTVPIVDEGRQLNIIDDDVPF